VNDAVPCSAGVTRDGLSNDVPPSVDREKSTPFVFANALYCDQAT
jgi:hypothetical protein